MWICWCTVHQVEELAWGGHEKLDGSTRTHINRNTECLTCMSTHSEPRSLKSCFGGFFFKSGGLWRANTEEFEALQWSLRSPQWWNPPQTLSIWRVFDGESFSDSLELWEAGGPERRGGCRHSVIELDMDRGCRTRCIHTTFSLVLILIRNPGVSSQETSKTGRPPVIRIPPALTFFSLRKKKSLHVYLY